MSGHSPAAEAEYPYPDNMEPNSQVQHQTDALRTAFDKGRESRIAANLDRIESAIALEFEGEGEAWSDKLSGDRLARVARDAIESYGLIEDRPVADREALARVVEQVQHPHIVRPASAATQVIVDAIFASGVVTEAGKPVADRAALAKALYGHWRSRHPGTLDWFNDADFRKDDCYAQADAILASGVITEADRPVVDREALIDLIREAVRYRNSLATMAGVRELADTILASGNIRDEREVKAEALDEEAARASGHGLYHEADWLSFRAAEIREGGA